MKNNKSLDGKYWDTQVVAFTDIYGQGESKILNSLNRTFRRDMYRRFDFTMKECEPVTDKSILDIGCGTGIYSVELAKRGAASVLGIDISERMTGEAKLLSEKHACTDRCSFKHIGLDDFSTEKKYDISFAMGFFDYVKEPVGYLKKIKSVTNEKMIVSFPSVWTWKVPVRKVIRKFKVYFVTKNEIARFMEAAGFKRYEIVTIGVLYCAIGYCGE